MPKRRKGAPVLIPQRALREALELLHCKPRSQNALRCLQGHIGDFAKQLVHGAAEERKRAFHECRRKQRLLSKPPNKKISEGDVRAALETPALVFCASGVAERTENMDKSLLPAARKLPPSAHLAGNTLTMNAFFVD